MGEEDNTVRIMSIHKSKGLEFPVVFLAGMGKKFNRQDVYGKVLIDPELGIAADYLDAEHRVKTSTIKKNVLRRKMELDSLGEELRVLYVAMTRAKEKLIMTGTDRSLGKTLEKYSQIPLANGQIPYTILSGAASFLDWILMCTGQTGNGLGILVRKIPVMEFIGSELQRQVLKRNAKDVLLEFDTKQEYDRDFGMQLKEHLEFVYPYMADVTLHSKMSVSEVKKMGQLADDESEVPFEPVKKASDASVDSGTGAARGSAYHRALELLPFDRIRSLEDVDAWLTRFVEEKQYTSESLQMVDSTVLWTFLCSETGRRMAKAQASGKLHKEQQFVMGIPAREIGPVDSDELVVIQGIIDAYFEEDGELILVDYKTDRIRSSRILLDHYQKQLDYYARALTQLTRKNVREKWIYSMTMQKAIQC